MSIINKSLAYSADTLVYNNECELLWPDTISENSLMLKYKLNTVPTFDKGTGTRVSVNPNIWKLTYDNSDWSSLLAAHYDLTDILSANTVNVTDMHDMLRWCTSLSSICELDTENVTNMNTMFNSCTSLQTVPLLNTRNVSSMAYMFNACWSLTSVPHFNTSAV